MSTSWNIAGGAATTKLYTGAVHGFSPWELRKEKNASRKRGSGSLTEWGRNESKTNARKSEVTIALIDTVMNQDRNCILL